MKITFSGSAFGDIEEVLAYHQDQGMPEVGKRLVAEIIDHIAKLSDHPELGRTVPEFDTPHLREHMHPPFRIVYRRQVKRVQIVWIWRSERLFKLP